MIKILIAKYDYILRQTAPDITIDVRADSEDIVAGKLLTFLRFVGSYEQQQYPIISFDFSTSPVTLKPNSCQQKLNEAENLSELVIGISRMDIDTVIKLYGILLATRNLPDESPRPPKGFCELVKHVAVNEPNNIPKRIASVENIQRIRAYWACAQMKPYRLPKAGWNKLPVNGTLDATDYVFKHFDLLQKVWNDDPETIEAGRKFEPTLIVFNESGSPNVKTSLSQIEVSPLAFTQSVVVF
jgi:hypothetical protein